MTIPTYEEILSRCLSLVPDTVDKREGSLIYTAMAPLCAELAAMYTELSGYLDLAFADTSCGTYLDSIVKQFGITRKAAACASRRGTFLSKGGEPFEVEIGSRFGCSGLFFSTEEQVGSGVYSLVCETAGTEGNTVSGELLPVEYLENFGSAALSDVLIEGEDEETDDELKERFFAKVSEPSFGGNISDYKEKTKAIDGVGAVKVTPGSGGAVGLTILTAGFSPPDETLVSLVQNTFYPPDGQSGVGLAPIGHTVTVTAAAPISVSVSSKVTLQDGYALGDVTSPVEAAVEAYLLSLREDWENQSVTVVRLSQIENSILSVSGVLDVEDTTVNAGGANLALGEFEVPVLSEVVIGV